MSAALSVTMSKLISHENCLLRAGKVEEELKKARENHNEWTRLCMLFGSADGKRFRTLAQSYTFEYLRSMPTCTYDSFRRATSCVTFRAR